MLKICHIVKSQGYINLKHNGLSGDHCSRKMHKSYLKSANFAPWEVAAFVKVTNHKKKQKKKQKDTISYLRWTPITTHWHCYKPINTVAEHLSPRL